MLQKKSNVCSHFQAFKWELLDMLETILLVMVALCNRADHYIFILWLLLSFFFFSSPNLSSWRLDVYHYYYYYYY